MGQAYKLILNPRKGAEDDLKETMELVLGSPKFGRFRFVLLREWPSQVRRGTLGVSLDIRNTKDKLRDLSKSMIMLVANQYPTREPNAVVCHFTCILVEPSKSMIMLAANQYPTSEPNSVVCHFICILVV